MKKKGGKLKWIIIVIVVIGVISAAAGGGDDESNPKTELKDEEKTIEANTEPKEKNSDEESSTENGDKKENNGNEEKDKYSVGDTYENKNLRMTYTNCYEFTDYEEYNAPSDGNKIICAEFEFENIGKSDTTAMYTDFHGYADGYEVEQSYAPDGTGMDFSLNMSPGRKGTGKIAFEVPVDATEIEIEFSPSFWSSEKVIFIYK